MRIRCSQILPFRGKMGLSIAFQVLAVQDFLFRCFSAVRPNILACSREAVHLKLYHFPFIWHRKEIGLTAQGTILKYMYASQF